MDTISLGKMLVDRAMFEVLANGSIDEGAAKHLDLSILVTKVYNDHFLHKKTVNEFAIFIGMCIANLGLMAEQRIEELERRDAN